ncbi:MAG: MarR family transcriptional regulator [Novosphingobium sp.]|nr:MarR family transcriptional regulator [Novosphingobium sp.]
MATSSPSKRRGMRTAPDVEEMFSFAVYDAVIGFQISRAADGLARALNAIIDSTGAALTTREFVILNLLHEESPLPQTQLVERSYKDPAATSRLVESLRKKGMVARVPSKADRRVTLISLTDKGEQTRALIVPELSALLRRAVGESTDEELRATQRVIKRIMAATLGPAA